MTRKLVDALARLGVTELSRLAGSAAVELLERLESSSLTASGLAGIVVDRNDNGGALRDPATRRALFDALRPEEAQRLASALGIEGPDPFAALAYADFTRSSEMLAVLHGFFEVPFQESSAERKSPSSDIAPSYTLFSHQRRASLAVREKLNTGARRVLLHMPTGSGKTRTAVTTLADILREEPDGQVVIWLAHSEELCEQAFEEICRGWEALGSRTLTIHRHFGEHRIDDLGGSEDGIIVASLQLLYRDTLSRQGAVLAIARRIRLIVMDEAHQAIAPTYSHLIQFLQRGRRTSVLGLSATPGRSLRDVKADIALATFFDRQKVKLEIEGYPTAIDYLTSEGYLAEIHYVRLPFSANGDFDLSEAEAERVSQGFDLPDRILDRLAADDMRNLLIVESVAAEVESGGNVILFAMSVEHATLIASVLSLRGVRAAAVTSSTPTERRREIIRTYRDGDGLRVLCNYGVLTTGFDAPKTDVAFIARPTSSVVLYSQMIGRAARGRRAGGNATCRVLTVVDRIPGFSSLADGFGFWDDIWEEDIA